MQRNPQPYAQNWRLKALVIWVVLLSPCVAILAIDGRAWRQTASPLSVTAALVGVGVGLPAMLFMLFFYGLPRWGKAHVGEDEASRWQFAAARAGMASVPLSVALVISRVLRDDVDLALWIGLPASLIVLALMAWFMARRFPDEFLWWPWRRQR